MTVYRFVGIFLALMTFSANPVVAQQIDKRAQQLASVAQLVSEKKFDEALGVIDPVIASYDAEYAASDKVVYCAADTKQSLVVLLKAAAAKKSAVTLDSTWCNALFIKAYILIDRNKQSDAGPYLKKATEMSPFNAHYLNEYAEWYKINRNWQTAYDVFSQARDLREFSPPDYADQIEARALRGMGFCLIELGKLDEAEKMFKDSLKLVPENQTALNEIGYIKELRAKK